MRMTIIDGPNLNMLGMREPHIYGTTTLEAVKALRGARGFRRRTSSFHQSNHEGELVDLIQGARTVADAIIINPAGFSFTSVALFDAPRRSLRGRHRGAHLQHPRAR